MITKEEALEALKELGVNDGWGNWYPLNELKNSNNTKYTHLVEQYITQQTTPQASSVSEINKDKLGTVLLNLEYLLNGFKDMDFYDSRAYISNTVKMLKELYNQTHQPSLEQLQNEIIEELNEHTNLHWYYDDCKDEFYTTVGYNIRVDKLLFMRYDLPLKLTHKITSYFVMLEESE